MVQQVLHGLHAQATHLQASPTIQKCDLVQWRSLQHWQRLQEKQHMAQRPYVYESRSHHNGCGPGLQQQQPPMGGNFHPSPGLISLEQVHVSIAHSVCQSYRLGKVSSCITAQHAGHPDHHRTGMANGERQLMQLTPAVRCHIVGMNLQHKQGATASAHQAAADIRLVQP